MLHNWSDRAIEPSNDWNRGGGRGQADGRTYHIHRGDGNKQTTYLAAN